MQIRHPKTEEIESLSDLWAEAFGEGDAYCSRFFSEVFCPQNSLVACSDGKLCAMLHSVKSNWGSVPARYLYAVATGRKYRSRGIFSALHHAFLDQITEDIVFLIPEGESLREFYNKFGYRTLGFAPRFSPKGERISLSADEAYRLYRQLRSPSSPCLSEAAFSITAMGKEFFSVPGEIPAFFVETGAICTSFLQGKSGDEIPTAMALSRSGTKLDPQQIPFFLN